MTHRAEMTKELTNEEFRAILQSLKNGKACGLDGLPNELIKNALELTHEYLRIFVNTTIRLGKVPHKLNKGKVILLFKGGSRMTKCYRPINSFK